MNATDLVVQEFDIPETTLPICTDAQAIESSAEVMTVDSPKAFVKGAEALAVIKYTKKKVVNALKVQKQNAHKVHSAICKYEAKLSEPLDHAEDLMKQKMSDWYVNQKEIEDTKIENGEVCVSVIPETPNIGVRENWKAEIIDESKIPQKFWSVDKKKLAEYAKQTKGVIEVGGVEFSKGITIINNS